MIAALLAVLLSAHAQEERVWIPRVGPRDAIAQSADLGATPATMQYPQAVYDGARQLGLRREFVHFARQGLDLLYQRRYSDTRAYFVELQQEFPETAVSPIADVLVYQAMMLENFDFRYDAEYKAASERAKTQLTAAAARPGNDAWEQFMLGGMVGLEAIHAARNGRYLPALTTAFSAIDHIERARKVAPNFVDLSLADGLYNYWRTVITDSSSLLPSFGDKKAVGLEQIEKVEDSGIFLGPPATLAMLFSWMEEKDYDKALASGTRNQRKYPNNLINELMTGIVQLYRKDYPAALSLFDHVRKLDANNVRVRYYRGVALYRLGRHDEALGELKRYTESKTPDADQKAVAWWRIGEVHREQSRWAEAEAAFKTAIKLNGEPSAKAALDKLYEKRKAGEITW